MTNIDASKFYRDAARFAKGDEDLYTDIINKLELIASHDLQQAIDILHNVPVADFVREHEIETRQDWRWRYVR